MPMHIEPSPVLWVLPAPLKRGALFAVPLEGRGTASAVEGFVHRKIILLFVGNSDKIVLSV